MRFLSEKGFCKVDIFSCRSDGFLLFVEMILFVEIIGSCFGEFVFVVSCCRLPTPDLYTGIVELLVEFVESGFYLFSGLVIYQRRLVCAHQFPVTVLNAWAAG